MALEEEEEEEEKEEEGGESGAVSWVHTEKINKCWKASWKGSQRAWSMCFGINSPISMAEPSLGSQTQRGRASLITG